MSKTRRKLTICNNCGTTLMNHENFCPNCGQENHDKQASTVQLANDFMEDYVGFDNKIVRSIIPLLINPGRMTVEFLDGKRKKYISPIRLFIFLTFIYFAVYLWLYSDWEGTITIEGHQPTGEQEEEFVRNFQNNLNLIAFLFLPIQALLIMALFWTKNRRYFVNYFVYTLHLFSFLLFLGIIVQFVHWFIPDDDFWSYFELGFLFLLVVYIIYYSIISLKRVFNKKYNIPRFIIVLSISILAFSFTALGFILVFAWFYEI